MILSVNISKPWSPNVRTKHVTLKLKQILRPLITILYYIVYGILPNVKLTMLVCQPIKQITINRGRKNSVMPYKI